MITDEPPRKANHRKEFRESHRIKTLDLPQNGSLLAIFTIRRSGRGSGAGGSRCYYDGEPVTRFGCYSLRHGLGTWLAENGTSPEVIQRMSQQQGHDGALHPRSGPQGTGKHVAELGSADR